MIFNRAGGGGEKVTINGKKVTEKLNLKGATGIVKGRADFLTNTKILGHIDELFYIMQGTALYKGSPYSGWSLEFDFSSISDFDYNQSNVGVIDIKDNSCIIYFFKVKDTSTRYSCIMRAYEIKNGVATELKKLDIYGNRVNPFLLNNIMYAFSSDTSSMLYKLNGNSMTNTGLSDYTSKTAIVATNYNGNRYFIYVNKTVGGSNSGMNITKFDGTKFSEQEFNYSFSVYNADNYKFSADNTMLANPNRLAFYITNQGRYDLLDSSFKSVDSGDEGGLSFSQIACLYKDNKYRYLLTQGGKKPTLEFPVNVYC